MHARDVSVELEPSGLSTCCHPKIHRLGRRGARLIYQAHPGELQTSLDPSSGLTLFPIEDVFLDRTSILIGCGTPNVAISVYRHDGPKGPGWYKLAGFMFWRQASYIAPAKGRLQTGVYLELRGTSQQVRDDLWQAMNELSGKRSASCAHLNAQALARAGFTLGNGDNIIQAVRPSKYAAILWEHGIAHKGSFIDTRIIVTGDKGVGDHMKGTWLKEASAPVRTIRKTFARRSGHTPAPVFDGQSHADALSDTSWQGHPVTIDINRPSRLGANLTFLFGQQPVYSITLDNLGKIEALHQPLQPFPGELDRVTKVKKHVLFSRPVIATIRRSRHRSVDTFSNVPAGAALDMLTPSSSSDYAAATLYNCVVTLDDNGHGKAHITPLKNQTASKRFVKLTNWILAKHVLLSGYHPRTVGACELWCYRDESGQLVACFNNNSGTYKPDEARGQALQKYLQQMFGIPVNYSPIQTIETAT